jgi:hypothetical protein
MRTAADYFGLMAYIWVMSGGMPADDLISPAQRTEQRPPRRGRARLRVIQGTGGQTRRARAVAQARQIEADEAVA